MKEILRNDFFEKRDVSKVDVGSEQANAVEQMKAVNNLNWQQLVKMNHVKEGETELGQDRPMKDYESITMG